MLKQHDNTQKLTWVHTDNKAQVQTWKMGVRENKTSMFALPDSHAAPGFLMEKHISALKPSQLRSFSVCGLSVINLFLTEARLYVRFSFFFFCWENVLCADHFGREELFICLAQLGMELLPTKWIKFSVLASSGSSSVYLDNKSALSRSVAAFSKPESG